MRALAFGTAASFTLAGGLYAPTVLVGSQRSEGPTAVHPEIPVALDDPQQGHALADIHI